MATTTIQRPAAASARGKALLLLTLLTAVVVTAVARPAAADDDRSYRIADVQISADLLPDGDLRIVEDRTFAYDGTFRGAFYNLPLDGVEAITDFTLTDSTGVTYRPGDVDSEEPGTYAITSEDPFEVTWFYGAPATDEQRTYTLSYTMQGVGTRHADAAELYVKWVGRGWDVPTDRVVADVSLPEAGGPLLAGDTLHIFAHGPLDATVEEVEPGVVRTAVTDLEPNTFLELRALMPPEALAEAPSTGREVREDILAEEQCLAIASDARRARARGEEPAEDCEPGAALNLALTGILGAGLLGGAGAWVMMFRRHGREHPLPPDLQPTEFAPPSDDPPALVGWLRHWGAVPEQAFVATLLDLARRGILELRRTVPDSGGLGPEDGDETLVIRRIGQAEPGDRIGAGVLNLLRRIGGDREEVTDEQLADWVEGHRDSAYSWWQEWTATVGEAGRARQWIEPKRWMWISVALGLGLAAAAVGLWIAGARWWVAMPALVVGVVFLAASPLLRRRTPEGNLLHERWDRYAAFLRQQAAVAPQQPAETLMHWGNALPYAVVLGFADEIVRALDSGLSPEQLRAAGGGWYPLEPYAYGRPGYGYGYDDRSEEGYRAGTRARPRMAPGMAAITALPASSIASAPASQGSGGGASAGGGGGAGGSGGGAF